MRRLIPCFMDGPALFCFNKRRSCLNIEIKMRITAKIIRDPCAKDGIMIQLQRNKKCG